MALQKVPVHIPPYIGVAIITLHFWSSDTGTLKSIKIASWYRVTIYLCPGQEISDDSFDLGVKLPDVPEVIYVDLVLTNTVEI